MPYPNIIDLGFRSIPKIDYSGHPAYGKIFGRQSVAERIEALKIIWPHLKNYGKKVIKLYLHGLYPRLPENIVNQRQDAVLEALIRDGAVPFRLQDDLTALRSIAMPYVERLKQRKAAAGKGLFLDKVMIIERKEIPELYDLVQKILEARNIFEASERYRGRTLKLTSIALQIDQPTDTDWKNKFADINLVDPSTVYFHVDGTIRWLKCIIYLSNVTAVNGPFSYVIGSHRLRQGFIEYILRKANDRSRLDKCDPATRRLFSALPKIFQKKGEFGNDMLDTELGSKLLLAAEHKFTTEEDGDMIFFDGDGVHRGGMVKEGERQILQVRLE